MINSNENPVVMLRNRTEENAEAADNWHGIAQSRLETMQNNLDNPEVARKAYRCCRIARQLAETFANSAYGYAKGADELAMLTRNENDLQTAIEAREIARAAGQSAEKAKEILYYEANWLVNPGPINNFSPPIS